MNIYTRQFRFIFSKLILSMILLPASFNVYANNVNNITSEVKSYITGIKSIAVEFVQKDSGGKSARGMLIIDKPHKFRCNYYEPFPILIVGNVNYISLYDFEMNNLSRVKAEENIFNFLLVDNIDFDDKLEIMSAKEKGDEYIIRVNSRELNKISEIIFDKKTKDIKIMRIFEENNLITLTFGKTRQITNIASSLFILKDPDIYGKPERLNKDNLEKKFNIVR